MTQKEIIRHFNEIGGLRCKHWTLQEIREYIHENIPECKRVLTTTCRELKRTAEMYQR